MESSTPETGEGSTDDQTMFEELIDYQKSLLEREESKYSELHRLQEVLEKYDGELRQNMQDNYYVLTFTVSNIDVNSEDEILLNLSDFSIVRNVEMDSTDEELLFKVEVRMDPQSVAQTNYMEAKKELPD